MLILTNALSETADEGTLRVASRLTEELRRAFSDVRVVSYQRRSRFTDDFLSLNKLFWNRSLYARLNAKKEAILYIPFPARMLPTAFRIWNLSVFSKNPLTVLLVMTHPMNFAAAFLLRHSRARLLVLSEDAKAYYRQYLPRISVETVRAGVDTVRFSPVSAEKARMLKEKYGFQPGRPIVLHVGHMQRGRNLGQLMKIDPKYQVLIVTSSYTKSEEDQTLKEELRRFPHIRLIDTYQPHIEEIFQMSDVYCFPTRESGHCIDVPLSCLEAAACGKPVVTTDYGEMKSFRGKSGFYWIENRDAESLNALIAQALSEKTTISREAVMSYDWKSSARQIGEMIHEIHDQPHRSDL